MAAVQRPLSTAAPPPPPWSGRPSAAAAASVWLASHLEKTSIQRGDERRRRQRQQAVFALGCILTRQDVCLPPPAVSPLSALLPPRPRSRSRPRPRSRPSRVCPVVAGTPTLNHLTSGLGTPLATHLKRTSPPTILRIGDLDGCTCRRNGTKSALGDGRWAVGGG